MNKEDEIRTLRAQLEAAEELNRGAEEIARIYFQIAAEAIGEEAVRAKRDHEIVQVASMRARAEADEADAARYRWLRHHDWEDEGLVGITTGYDVRHPTNEDLDAFIDAARTKEQQA